MDAQEPTVIHIFFVNRCSLLLLLLCRQISSLHHQLCWVTLEHCLRHLQQTKQTYFWWHLQNLYWWLLTNLVGNPESNGLGASLTRASESTVLPSGASSCFASFPFSFLPDSFLEVKLGQAPNYFSLYKTVTCPGCLYFTGNSWRLSENSAKAEWLLIWHRHILQIRTDINVLVRNELQRDSS